MERASLARVGCCKSLDRSVRTEAVGLARSSYAFACVISPMRGRDSAIAVSMCSCAGTIEAWRADYNLHRPHSSLGNRTPREYLDRQATADDCTALVQI
jgi:hypothetical protein